MYGIIYQLASHHRLAAITWSETILFCKITLRSQRYNIYDGKVIILAWLSLGCCFFRYIFYNIHTYIMVSCHTHVCLRFIYSTVWCIALKSRSKCCSSKANWLYIFISYYGRVTFSSTVIVVSRIEDYSLGCASDMRTCSDLPALNE